VVKFGSFPLETRKTTFFAEIFKIQGASLLPVPSFRRPCDRILAEGKSRQEKTGLYLSKVLLLLHNCLVLLTCSCSSSCSRIFRFWPTQTGHSFSLSA